MFIQTISIILFILGTITLIVGLFFKKKSMTIIGSICLSIIFIIWIIIFGLVLAEENPSENINSENTNTKDKNNVTIQENINENKNEEQPQDVTKKILNNEFYSSGKIYNIDENNIYFSNEDSKKYYINKNVFQYFNGRTAKNMDSVDIKVGDYLNQSDGKILIYRNVSGEELNQELLYNLTLDEDERIMMVNTIEIENINIQDKDTAIVEIKYGDLFGDELTDETFETTVEFNSNTKFYSKGRNINSINDLEEARYNINSIVLDRNTINKKSPAVVKKFESTDN